MDLVNTKIKAFTDFTKQRQKEIFVFLFFISATILFSVSLVHHSSTHQNLKLLNESHNVIDQNSKRLISALTEDLEDLKIQMSNQKEEANSIILDFRHEIGDMKKV